MLKTSKNQDIWWSAMSKVLDIRPRKGKWKNFCVVDTEAGSFCAPEWLAQKLCLYEPYSFKGNVILARGGTYLWVKKAELFESGMYEPKWREGVPDQP